MVKAKVFIWIAAGITALALSATTILAAQPPADTGSAQSPAENAVATMLRPIFQLHFGNDSGGADQTRQAGKAKKSSVADSASAQATQAVAAAAPDEDDRDDEDQDVDDDDEVASDEQIASLASHFKVGLNTVRDLRDKEGLGYGGIFKALQIASSAEITGTGKITGTLTITQTLKLVLEARDDQGWGQVYRQFGLHPGNHGNNFGSIMSGRAITSTVPITDTWRLRDDGKDKVKDNGKGADNRDGNGNGNDDGNKNKNDNGNGKKR